MSGKKKLSHMDMGKSEESKRKGGFIRIMKWLKQKMIESYAFSVLVAIAGIALMALIAFWGR